MLHEERKDCVSTEKSHLCTKKRIYVFPEMKLCGHVPNSNIHVYQAIYIFPGLVCLSLEYINRLQIHECGNWETEHYNAGLEIMRLLSFISGNS